MLYGNCPLNTLSILKAEFHFSAPFQPSTPKAGTSNYHSNTMSSLYCLPIKNRPPLRGGCAKKLFAGLLPCWAATCTVRESHLDCAQSRLLTEFHELPTGAVPGRICAKPPLGQSAETGKSILRAGTNCAFAQPVPSD